MCACCLYPSITPRPLESPAYTDMHATWATKALIGFYVSSSHEMSKSASQLSQETEQIIHAM